MILAIKMSVPLCLYLQLSGSRYLPVRKTAECGVGGCKTYLYFNKKAQHFWKVRTLEDVSFPNQLLRSKWNFCCCYLSFWGRMFYHVKHRQRREIILLKKCSSRQSGLAWQLCERSLLQNLKIFGEMALAHCSLKTVFPSDLQETLSKRRAWGRYMMRIPPWGLGCYFSYISWSISQIANMLIATKENIIWYKNDSFQHCKILG